MEVLEELFNYKAHSARRNDVSPKNLSVIPIDLHVEA